MLVSLEILQAEFRESPRQPSADLSRITSALGGVLLLSSLLWFARQRWLADRA